MAKINSTRGKTETGAAEQPRKIFIVDDHPMMREGLRSIINLEPDLTICGEADNARKALAQIEKAAPDLALVDITLPDKSGLELVKDLKALCPALSILAISMHDESLYAERMLRAGAKGYINKHQPPAELLRAIRQVLAGDIYTSPEISQSIMNRFSHGTSTKLSPLEILTDREFEIFQLLGQGHSSKEIAQRLRLSDNTVAVHNANIRGKLRIKTTAQLIRLAVESDDTTG